MGLEPDGRLEVRSALRWSRSERPWPRSRGSYLYLRLSSCHTEQERPKVTVVRGRPLTPEARCDERMEQAAAGKVEESAADFATGPFDGHPFVRPVSRNQLLQ